MFGHNVPRRRDHGDMLQVHDVFYTIQGEGPFAGDPAVFIRLTGCNLRCWFCDTEWGDESDRIEHYQDWADRAARANEDPCDLLRERTDLVVLTGGEPLRQDLGPLIQSLFRNGFRRVQIETAGSFWQACCDWPGVTVVVSPKTSKVRKEFYSRIKAHWKYVIKAGEVDEHDGLPSAPMQRVGNKIAGGAPARPPAGALVYLQPVDEHDKGGLKSQANLIAMRESSLKFGYRAGLQMHKYLELP